MKNKNYFKDKRVAIIGLARSGFACANLLYDLGAKVCVSDNSRSELLSKLSVQLQEKGMDVELGRNSDKFIKGSDIVVVSPGVSDDAIPVALAVRLGIPVISEIEVGFILCPATIIAVTGSNGKTTVTTLIGKILTAGKAGLPTGKAGRKRVFVCGNIGNPFCGEVTKMQEGDFVCLEVSSFQLEKIKTFKPYVSVILNLTANHLDRYKDIDEYWAAKKRLFMNQDKDDYLVTNGDDPLLSNAAREAKSKVIFFSESSELNPDQAAVVEVGNILGISRDICLGVFKEFRGLEHRLEFVEEINKVKFINDSKATTADSCVWALKNITEPVILIAGGKDKGVDYGSILKVAEGKVKEVILIGQAKEKIKDALRAALPIDEAVDLREAVNKAFTKSSPGDCVLLSPMCSSFDMFSNYEERGRVFKEAVAVLRQKVAIPR